MNGTPDPEIVSIAGPLFHALSVQSKEFRFQSFLAWLQAYANDKEIGLFPL